MSVHKRSTIFHFFAVNVTSPTQQVSSDFLIYICKFCLCVYFVVRLGDFCLIFWYVFYCFCSSIFPMSSCLGRLEYHLTNNNLICNMYIFHNIQVVSVLFVLWIMLSTCKFHLESLLKVTPKCLWKLETGSSSQFNLNFSSGTFPSPDFWIVKPVSRPFVFQHI